MYVCMYMYVCITYNNKINKNNNNKQGLNVY